MKSLKKIHLVVTCFLVLSAAVVFAGTLTEMRQKMWVWSCLEAVVCDAQGPGSTPPVVDIKEAFEEIAAAQKYIETTIAGLKTAEEIAAARVIAREFIDMGEKEEDVGLAVNRLLDRQEKFLQAHQN